MIKALENPHFKKISEEINWKVRHPEAKSLEEALFLETHNMDCNVLHCGLNLIVSMQSLCLLKNSGFHLGDRQYHAFSQSFGRPITLEDILHLLNKQHLLYVADGTKIYFIDKNAKGTKIFCDFTSNLLEEQTPETWEKISK